MKYLASLVLILSLTSCVETVVVGGVATGAIMAKEKSATDTANDVTIETKILKEFTLQGLKNPVNQIGVVVDKQRVMLTGVVDNPKLAKKANEISWNVKGVKEVIDEIQVVDNKSAIGGVIDYFKDASITAQVNSRLLFNKNIATINIKTITVNRVVYLIGIARSQSEIDLANRIAARTAGVKKVINHIIL